MLNAIFAREPSFSFPLVFFIFWCASAIMHRIQYEREQGMKEEKMIDIALKED